MLGGVPESLLATALGAVVSRLYNDLYRLSKQAAANIVCCKKYCKELADDLEFLQPSLFDICNGIDRNPELLRSWRPALNSFKSRLEEGKNLVDECSKLSRLDLIRKHSCGKSIGKLQKGIGRFIRILGVVSMDIQVHSMDIQVKHNDQLATTLEAYHDAGQETKERLRALGYEQTRFAHEILSCLEKLSMTQKDCFEELKRELQFHPDELQNTVNRAIANTTEESTSATETGSSVNRLLPSVETLMLPNFLVGISEPLQKFKEQLVSEKESVMVVGIKGMGGIGKTTLASALCSDQEVRDFFKGGIHFVTVSQSPNLLEILKSVWKKLKGGMVPCFQNKEDARRQLQGAISSLKSPMLMVLDDMWSRAHLEDLIFHGEQCKIVFTTRQVCTVSVKDAFLYEVSLLSEDDALRLFCFYAFEQESIPERYNTSVVKEVQDKCKRLPLALKVVGECLVGKLDIFWRSAKKKLRQAQAIETYHKEALLEHLQTSFDAIKDVKLQQCFIDFGSFPEDRKISVQLLFDMWIYVRGMDWDDAVTALEDLSNRCLVDMADDTFRANILSYGSATDIVCSQHDVLRHLALYLGRIAHLPDSGSIKLNYNDLPPYRRKWLLMPQKSQIPEDWKISGTDYSNAEIISINTEALTKEHWSTGMSFPTTKALLLYLDGESSDLPTFRESMPELKVLVIQSSTSCNVMNLEVLDGLAHLQILYLQGFNNDDFHCFRGFQGLQKLYLTDLGQFYTLEGILSGPSCTLTDLILRLCNGLETMMINKTYLIPSLRRLFLENCSTLPNLPGNIGSSLANLEVLSLKSCEHLETLPDLLCNLAKLQHLDLSHCNGIRALPEDFGQLSNLRDLKLAFCDKLRALPSSITQLHSLHLLLMVECNELESLPEDFGKLRKLYNLELHSNRKLQRLPSSIRELRALTKVTCDDKFLGQWESFKESHLSGLQVHRFVSQS